MRAAAWSWVQLGVAEGLGLLSIAPTRVADILKVDSLIDHDSALAITLFTPPIIARLSGATLMIYND